MKRTWLTLNLLYCVILTKTLFSMDTVMPSDTSSSPPTGAVEPYPAWWGGCVSFSDDVDAAESESVYIRTLLMSGAPLDDLPGLFATNEAVPDVVINAHAGLSAITEQKHGLHRALFIDRKTTSDNLSVLPVWAAQSDVLTSDAYVLSPHDESLQSRLNWGRTYYASARSSQTPGTLHFNLTKFVEDPSQNTWLGDGPESPHLDISFDLAKTKLRTLFAPEDQDFLTLFFDGLMAYGGGADHKTIKTNIVEMVGVLETLSFDQITKIVEMFQSLKTDLPNSAYNIHDNILKYFIKLNLVAASSDLTIESVNLFMGKLFSDTHEAPYPLVQERLKHMNLVAKVLRSSTVSIEDREAIIAFIISGGATCEDAALTAYDDIMIRTSLVRSQTPRDTLLSIGLNQWKKLKIRESLGAALLAEAESLETEFFTHLQVSDVLGLMSFAKHMHFEQIGKGKSIHMILERFYSDLNYKDFLHFLSQWSEWNAFLQRTMGSELPGYDPENPVPYLEASQTIALEALTTLGFVTPSVDYPLPHRFL